MFGTLGEGGDPASHSRMSGSSNLNCNTGLLQGIKILLALLIIYVLQPPKCSIPVPMHPHANLCPHAPTCNICVRTHPHAVFLPPPNHMQFSCYNTPTGSFPATTHPHAVFLPPQSLLQSCPPRSLTV